MNDMIDLLFPAMKRWRETIESVPMDGDEVDDFCDYVKIEVNRHQGNTTDEEYRKQINEYVKRY